MPRAMQRDSLLILATFGILLLPWFYLQKQINGNVKEWLIYWYVYQHNQSLDNVSFKLFISYIFFFLSSIFFTPPRNRVGVIFSLKFVCVPVCVSGTSCEKNFSQTDAPIWTQIWIWWPWVKGQGHIDVMPIFSS